ncbi:MAG: HNH endonuclease [Acidobacteriia bacterium]|nr:HNH endonuclease [Terriglobia bacterium]
MLTEEHLIPDAIGGRLTCNFLCKHCNDHMGQLEAGLKEDPGIRWAIENLKDTLPNLWATMSQGQAYVVQGPGGTVGAKLEDGDIRVTPSRRSDDSLVVPLKDAPEVVRKTLERRGATSDEIRNAMTNLKEVPEGSRVKIAEGIEIVKSAPVTAYPALKSHDNDLALLKIAYEYVALHLGRKIFDGYFDSVRAAFVKGGSLPSCCSVKPYRERGSGFQPFHRLAVKNTTDGLIVGVHFFGYLKNRVEFLRPQIAKTGLFCYTLRLDTREEECTEV